MQSCIPAPDRQTAISRLLAAIEVVENRPQPGSEPSAQTPRLGLGWPGADRAVAGGLRHGAIHEWLSGADTDTSWTPPLGVLIHGARAAVREDTAGRRAVWIGRRIWPHAHAIRDSELLARSLFVAAETQNERLWATDLALRCPGVGVVIADGSGLGMSESRRLQLAAGAGGSLCLLTRPWRERREVSAAWTRWRVEPALSDESDPRWSVELLRCKGVRPAAEDARRWVVCRDHETGDVRVVPDAVDRPGQAARSPTQHPARRWA